MRKEIIILLIIIVFSITYRTAYSQDATMGRTAYETHCSMCHGIDGKGGSSNFPVHSLNLPDFSNPEYKTFFVDERAKEVIMNGKPGTDMRGWKEVLSPEEINGIIEYIKAF